MTSRAFSILGAFSAEDTSLSLATISRRTGLPVGTAHRLVKELCAFGALDRVEGGAYVIGLRMWMIGSLAARRQRFVERARPQMQELYDAVHQTILLAVRHDDQVLCIDKVVGARTVAASHVMAIPQPLHCTAAGKVLTAFGTPEAFARLLAVPLSRPTPYSITAPSRLREELAEVCTRGFAVSVEENELGRAAIAAPVFGLPGQVAALGVAVEAQNADVLTRFAGPLRQATATLSRRLGHVDQRVS